MLAIIGGALAARRAQALAVLLLAVLASAAAAAAPSYVAAAGRALASDEFSTADPDELRLRLVDPTEYPGMPGNPARGVFGVQVERLAPAGFAVVLGAQSGGVATGPAGRITSNLIFRTGVCERVAVVGACPRSTAKDQLPEVLVSTNTAAHLGVAAGGEFTFGKVPVRVAGVYRPLDATDPFWLGGEYLRPPAPGSASASAVGSAADAIFTAESAPLADEQAILYRSTADLFVTEQMLSTRSAQDLRATVAAVTRDGSREGFGAGTALPRLLDRITLQREQLAAGVTLGAGLLVLLCWLVLFVAVSSAADERRPEQGLLLLRGVQRRRLWALAIGEHAVPVLVAIPLGCLGGLAAADLLAAQTLPARADVMVDATVIGYAAVGAAGALTAVLLAQVRALSAPVVDLLRRVPARMRGWRATVGDIVAVSIAVAAVVQLRSGGSPSGLALLAPLAGALAAGVLLARVAMIAGAAVGARLLARGRTTIGLALVQVARQPRFRPLIALLTVVVAMLAFTAATSEVASAAYADRATVEVGAPRVVGVDAMSHRHLLESVRAADPEGRFAMAATVKDVATGAGTSVLAVDSDRLAMVAAPHPSYGVALADVARELRPDPPGAPILLRGRQLTVALSASYDEEAFGGNRVRLFVSVASRAGTRRITAHKDIKPDLREYRVEVPECAQECRLVNLEIVAPVTPGPLTVRFEELRTGDSDAERLTGAELTDVRRWRQSDPMDTVLTTTSGPDAALVFDVAEGRRSRSLGIAVVDAPFPLPGWSTRSKATPVHGIHPYEGIDGSVTQALIEGLADGLPRLGPSGMIVDLEYADRLAVAGQTGVKEVWMTPTAPPDILDRLRAQGLVVKYDRTITGVSQDFDRQGAALALRFNLFAALAGVLIGAAGLIAAAAADQRNRVAMLVALRRQGLRARAVRGGYGWPVAVATVSAGLATLVIWLLTRGGQRLFSDGRSPVPLPDWPDVGRLLLFAAPTVALFAVTAAVLGRFVAASVRRRTGR
ncbi:MULTISPECIES: FtsX-like permease family protein [unclassified Micromonospora]|uniref:FtsX-like permease family protein n=1 Tax=unclassified Micromonospora TaxID=2617518 RepID=UPI000EF55561|nr:MULTISPECIES: FtsX-like permease family protein [unclassified Micromonospora]RLP92570.1 FtsX-like permease family protein [Micromonospora sp. CV4]RLP96107.1 FtsX-like permease family protein [Micromonospora sp. BL4]